MAAPQLSRDWQTSTATVANGTVAVMCRQVLFQLKQLLVGASSDRRWTVYSSSDSVSAGSSDLWVADTNVVWKSVANTAHSWVVLYNSTLGLYMCLDFLASANQAFQVVFDTSAPTGGTTLARPTFSAGAWGYTGAYQMVHESGSTANGARTVSITIDQYGGFYALNGNANITTAPMTATNWLMFLYVGRPHLSDSTISSTDILTVKGPIYNKAFQQTVVANSWSDMNAQNIFVSGKPGGIPTAMMVKLPASYVAAPNGLKSPRRMNPYGSPMPQSVAIWAYDSTNVTTRFAGYLPDAMFVTDLQVSALSNQVYVSNIQTHTVAGPMYLPQGISVVGQPDTDLQIPPDMSTSNYYGKPKAVVLTARANRIRTT